jgi:CfrBI restriction endonuclease
MTKLCEMAGVPKEYYNQEKLPKSVREVDFYLFDGKNEPQKCEVKLMGKGNPESADGALARDVKIFVADKLSDLNKQELERKQILWVELRGQESLIKFKEILTELQIPFILDKLDI